jgi:hypothetical protein
MLAHHMPFVSLTRKRRFVKPAATTCRGGYDNLARISGVVDAEWGGVAF